MYKLVVSDYDGTLVVNGKVLSREFWQKLNKISACGTIFAVSSGRTYCSLKKLFSSAFANTVFIANDGAQVMHGNCLLYKNPVDKNYAKELCKLAANIGAEPYIALREEVIKVKSAMLELNYFVSGDIFKVIIEKNGNNTDFIKKAAENFNVRTCFEDGTYIEFCNSSANKGTALKYIADKFAVKKEDIIVFGDGVNDLPMLKLGGKKIASANACSQVREISDEISANIEKYIIDLA